MLSLEEEELVSEFMSTAQMKLMQLEVQKEILELQAQVPDILQRASVEDREGDEDETAEEMFKVPVISEGIAPTDHATAVSLLLEGKSVGDVAKELGIPLPLVLQAKRAMNGG